MERDSTPLSFGKYKGKTPEEISDIAPEYIVWMYRTMGASKCSKLLFLHCLDEAEMSYLEELRGEVEEW